MSTPTPDTNSLIKTTNSHSQVDDENQEFDQNDNENIREMEEKLKHMNEEENEFKKAARYDEDELNQEYEEHMKKKEHLNYPVQLDDIQANSGQYEPSVAMSKFTKATGKSIATVNPYNAIDVTLKVAKEKLAIIKAKSSQLDEIDSPDRKKKFLKNENKQLRDQLATMSDNVNLLIEQMNKETLRKRRLGLVQNDEVRVKAAEQEIVNNDKSLLLLYKEHGQLRKRLEEVRNPQFLINLKRKIGEADEAMKVEQKRTKQLYNDQIKRENRLEKIISKNEPETMKQIGEYTSRLAYLNQKLSELNVDKMKGEEQKINQEVSIDDLKLKMMKLQQIASQYGINLDTHEETLTQSKVLNEKFDALVKKKNVLTTAIDVQNKKFDNILKEKKIEMAQLQYSKATVVHGYNAKISDLRDKGQQIQELIEKARPNADGQLTEVLEKWEEANLKIFEKHPEHAPEDLGVLEEALEQVHRKKDPKEQELEELQKLVVSPKTLSPNSKSRGGRYSGDQKEQSVQAYLKRIHHQEEDMLLKAKEGTEAVRNKRRQDMERQKQLEEDEKRRIQEEKDLIQLQIKQKIEEDLRARLTASHQKELEEKEEQRQQVEAKLQEFMSEHDKLLEEKVKIQKEGERLLQEKQEQEEQNRQAIMEEADLKLKDKEKEYEVRLAEEKERRENQERIHKGLEEQQSQMEDNKLKRQEEESKLRTLEERVKQNQMQRLRALEEELHKRDANFDNAKHEEMQKLQEAERERVRRSLEFSTMIQTQEDAHNDQANRARIALEESIRLEEAEKRKEDVALFVARELQTKQDRDLREKEYKEQEYASKQELEGQLAQERLERKQLEKRLHQLEGKADQDGLERDRGIRQSRQSNQSKQKQYKNAQKAISKALNKEELVLQALQQQNDVSSEQSKTMQQYKEEEKLLEKQLKDEQRALLQLERDEKNAIKRVRANTKKMK